MSEIHDEAIDAPDDAVEKALTDHHLDEIAEMMEWADVDTPSPESPFSGAPDGYLRGP